MNAMFNIGLSDNMSQGTALQVMQAFYDSLVQKLGAAQTAHKNWNAELENERAELELTKTAYENYGYSVVRVENAEREYMQKRIEAAEKAFNEVKGLNEELRRREKKMLREERRVLFEEEAIVYYFQETNGEGPH